MGLKSASRTRPCLTYGTVRGVVPCVLVSYALPSSALVLGKVISADSLAKWAVYYYVSITRHKCTTNLRQQTQLIWDFCIFITCKEYFHNPKQILMRKLYVTTSRS